MTDPSTADLMVAINALGAKMDRFDGRLAAVEKAEWQCPFFPGRDENGHLALLRLGETEIAITKGQTILLALGALIAGAGAIGGILKAIEVLRGLIG